MKILLKYQERVWYNKNKRLLHKEKIQVQQPLYG